MQWLRSGPAFNAKRLELLWAHPAGQAQKRLRVLVKFLAVCSRDSALVLRPHWLKLSPVAILAQGPKQPPSSASGVLCLGVCTSHCASGPELKGPGNSLEDHCVSGYTTENSARFGGVLLLHLLHFTGPLRAEVSGTLLGLPAVWG